MGKGTSGIENASHQEDGQRCEICELWSYRNYQDAKNRETKGAMYNVLTVCPAEYNVFV